MLLINRTTRWQDLTPHLIHDQSITLRDSFLQTYFERLSASITGRSLVNAKVYSLIKAKVEDHIFEKFKIRYGEEESSPIDDAAAQLLRDCGLDYRDLNTTSAIRRIFERIESGAIPFAIQDRPRVLELKFDGTEAGNAHNMLNLLMGAPFDQRMLSWNLLKAILFTQNPQLMHEFRNALQSAIIKTSDQLNYPEPSESQKKMAEIFIANILSIFPFTEPPEGTLIQVPQKIGEEWVQVTYAVETMSLSPEWLGGKIPALGLRPITGSHPNASSLLLFRGTSHPTGSGFIASLFADSIPGKTVGEYIYKNHSKSVIDAWLESIPGKVNLYGQSLGGIYSLLTMADHLDKVAEVHIFGPPSLSGKIKKKCDARWDACQEKPSVNIYWNNGDIVPCAGKGFHTEWNVYKFFISEKQWGLSAHAALNSLKPKVIVMKINTSSDSQSTLRKIINLFHLIVSSILIVGLVTLIALKALKLFLITQAYRFRTHYFQPQNNLQIV